MKLPSIFKQVPPPPTVAEFYQQHTDEILKMVSRENLERVELANLKYEITAKSGKRYYSFPEKMALPFLRLAKGMELMDWLKNGISPEDFDTIREQLTISMAHIKAKSKEVADHTIKAGMLIAEMDRRRTMALPYYVLINICANYLIREDEDPSIISSQIHHEKCDEIQEEIESGSNAFFLTIPQLKGLSVMQRMSDKELNEYLQSLMSQAEHGRLTLKALISWTEQRKGNPTY